MGPEARRYIMSLAEWTQPCGPWLQAQETCSVLGGKEDRACWTPHRIPPEPHSLGAGGEEGPTEPPPSQSEFTTAFPPLLNTKGGRGKQSSQASGDGNWLRAEPLCSQHQYIPTELPGMGNFCIACCCPSARAPLEPYWPDRSKLTARDTQLLQEPVILMESHF